MRNRVSFLGGPKLELIKLVEFGLEEFLVWEAGLVFGDEGRGEGAAQGVFDDLVVLGGAEEHADGGLLMGLAHVAVESFEVEFELAQVFRLELVDLEFERHEALELRW